MENLKGFEKKYLRGKAHGLKPLVLIGKEGVTAGTLRAVDEGLNQHELIKVKFNDFNDKELKTALTDDIAKKTNSFFVGMTGHISTFYRQNADQEKRLIKLPVKNGARKSLKSS